MTIFILDESPKKIAYLLDDKSLNNMIKDIVQVLCNVHHLEETKYQKEYNKLSDFEQSFYDSRWAAGLQVPLQLKENKTLNAWTEWTIQAKANYLYICELGCELLNEYVHRFTRNLWKKEKEHKLHSVIEWACKNIPDLPDHLLLTNPPKPAKHTIVPLVMPNKYKLGFKLFDCEQGIDSVEQRYRNYYKARYIQNINKRCRESKRYGEIKTKELTWANRQKPEWLTL